MKLDKRNPKNKLQAIIETASLTEQELGEYLRKNGIHSSGLEDWKQEALSSLSTKRGRPKKAPELVTTQCEIKELKRDLRRKDKALAEQSAIIILQKKAKKLLMNDEDEGTI